MKTLTNEFKKILFQNGASLVGIGDLSEIRSEIRNNMIYGICIALAIPSQIINGISEVPTRDYYDTYNKLNEKLDYLVNFGAEYLNNMGFEAYPQTRDVVLLNETEYNSLLPYKTIATRAGIGWIGKNALLVTKEYGSAVRISTILTNANLEVDSPINKSFCGDCMICTNSCPAGAVKGTNWSRYTERNTIFDPVKCRRVAREIAKTSLNLDKEITLCGKCINVCPYTQAYICNDRS